MLTLEEIQTMLEEMGLGDTSEKSRLAEFDKWTELISEVNTAQLQTFIEIASTTKIDDKQGSEHGELGRYPK